jgi:hypothetical protein
VPVSRHSEGIRFHRNRGEPITVLMGAKRFEIKIGIWRSAHLRYHPAVRVELVIARLGDEELRFWQSEFKTRLMRIESRRPWRWYRVFNSRDEAVQFAEDLARSLGESAFLDNSRLCLVGDEG